MAGRAHLYLGKAGQHHAMSFFLSKGWNVAVPDVDIGDDVLVLRDGTGEFKRVQVKTARGVWRGTGFTARFKTPLVQLTTPGFPDLYFVFLVLLDGTWQLPMILERSILADEVQEFNVGSKLQGYVILDFNYQDGKLTCSNRDFSIYLNDFSGFPEIPH